jgi:hypothetical protein
LNAKKSRHSSSTTKSEKYDKINPDRKKKLVAAFLRPRPILGPDWQTGKSCFWIVNTANTTGNTVL